MLIDDRPINEYNLHSLRNLIAVVQQEPVLFDLTIEDNLRLGSEDMTEAQMVDACRQANAHDFMVQLSQVHTRLSPVRKVCLGLPYASG